MTYTLTISRAEDLIFTKTLTPDEVIDFMRPVVASSNEAPPKQKRKYKTRGRGPEKSEHDELVEATGRSRLDPDINNKIEQALIAGASVAQILEKDWASAPTIYVIKHRLKKEGRLTD